jgi:hypothetical protein
MRKLKYLKDSTMANGPIINFTGKENFIFRMALIILVPFCRAQLMVRVAIATIMGVFTKDKLKIIKLMDQASIMTLFKDMSIMDNGKMMFPMERANKNFKTVRTMREIFFMGLNRDLDIMCATLAFTRDSFQMEIFMEMESSPMLIIGSIKDNGKMD